MRMVRSIPALPVQDITQSVRFYCDKLGFTLFHQESDFAIIRRDAVELNLWAASDDSWQGRSDDNPVVSGAETFIAGTASCRVEVEDVDELYGDVAPLDILHPRGQISDQPWGSREFGVLDVDGNLLTFFQPI